MRTLLTLTLALTIVGCNNKKPAENPSAGTSADSTNTEALATEAIDEDAYSLEAIAQVIKDCDAVRSFSCGLAGVEKNDKLGFIDKMGNLVVPFKYESFSPRSFDGDTCWVMQDDDWVCIDKKGKELHRTKDFYIYDEGLARVRDEKTSLIGFQNQAGKLVIPHQFEFAGDFSSSMCWVTTKQSEGSIGFINTKGELVIPCQYEWPAERQPNDFHEGLCAVMVDESHEWFGYIDKTGKRAFPGIYSYESDFSEGLAGVYEITSTDEDGFPTGHRVGYIDKTGKMVIESEYDSGICDKFQDGMAVVSCGQKPTYVIDKTGKKLFELDPKYSISVSSIQRAYGEGAWIVSDGEFQGFVDKTGKFIVPCKYRAYQPFSNGLAAVQVGGQYGKWGYVDKEGNSTFDYE
ncbi:MAG: WG repeat-containing protein [Bacteroidaceae bacterium]|nr:WG repeat-containing protein [Bacteroidaceae bacterium]